MSYSYRGQQGTLHISPLSQRLEFCKSLTLRFLLVQETRFSPLGNAIPQRLGSLSSKH